MTFALQKVSEVATQTTQIRGDMKKAIQTQLQAIGSVTDAKIVSIVRELSEQLSTMII